MALTALRSKGLLCEVIPSVPSPLSTETKPLPLLTHHLKKDMNLITEGARGFCESESQSRCLLSNRALSPEPTGSLNRSQTATALGTEGQGKPSHRKHCLGPGSQRQETKGSKGEKREEEG